METTIGAIFGEVISAESLRKAFDAGRQARRENKRLDDNPHRDGAANRRKWYEGWCEQNLIHFNAEHR